RDGRDPMDARFRSALAIQTATAYRPEPKSIIPRLIDGRIPRWRRPAMKQGDWAMPTVLRIVAVSLLLVATASEAQEVRPRNSLHGAIVFAPKPIVRCAGVFKRIEPRIVRQTVDPKRAKIVFRDCPPEP